MGFERGYSAPCTLFVMMGGMEPLETFSVTQAAKLLGKAPNTLRTWSKVDYFGPYLSSYANPEPGGERRYTEDDIRVLRTAVILQKRGLQIADIIPRIAGGELLEELPGEEPFKPIERERESPGRELVPPSLMQQMELFLRPYESQIERLSAELERGRGELEQERESRIAAELELARLAAKLEERSKPWYKRLFGD